MRLAVAFTAALVALLLWTLGRAFSLVFVLNFSIEGPNETVLYVLLLASGLLYVVGLQRLWPPPKALLDVLVVLVGLGALASALLDGKAAFLAAVLVHLAALPVLLTRLRTPAMFWGLLFGLGLDLLARATLTTASVYSGTGGILWLLAAVAMLGTWLAIRHDTPQTPAGAAAVTALLWTHFAVTGSAAFTANWADRDLVLVALMQALGLLLAAWLATRPTRTHWSLPLFFFLVVMDLLWWNAAWHGSLVAATAIGLTLTRAALAGNGQSLRRTGAAMFGIQMAGILLLFLHVVAGNWSFVAAVPEVMSHGRAALYLFLVAALLPLTTLRAPTPHPERTPRIVGVVALVALAAPLAYALESPDPEPNTGPVRILTYNIHQGYVAGQSGDVNVEGVRDVIKASGATLIGLQESETARLTSLHQDALTWLASELDMHIVRGPPTSEQVYGVSLLSAYPVKESSWIHLPHPESIERVAVRAVLAAPERDVTLYVTHLSVRDFTQDRTEQAQALVLWAKEPDAILIGDMNTPATPGDPAYDQLTLRFRDAWLEAGEGDGFTEPADAPNVRIDHVFVGAQWDVTAAYLVGDPVTSDHLGLVVDLR